MDDVLVTPGACRQSGSCDFEDDECDWTNAATSTPSATPDPSIALHDWLRGSAADGANGPPIDHTTSKAEGTCRKTQLQAQCP